MSIRVTEPDETNQSTSPSSSGGFFGFLKRLLLAALKVGLVLLILAGLAYGAWLIFRELDRSFASVVTRMNRNTSRIEVVEADLASALDQNAVQQGRIESLQNDLATREAQINELDQEMGAELERQGEQLTGLDGDTGDLIAQTGVISGEVSSLGAGLLVLQEDINANSQQVDELGGSVDGLLVAQTELETAATTMQAELDRLANEELAGWRRVVRLFRVWELVSRARLRLVEDNAGLALADLEAAMAAADELAAGEAGGPEAEILDLVRARLVLAADNLPDQPAVAARDLESAWEALDELIDLVLVFTIGPAAAETIEAEEAVPGVTPTPTSTP